MSTAGAGPDRARSLPLVGLGVGVLVAVLALVAGSASGLGTGYFTRETQAVLDGPWYAGAAALVGYLLWWTAALAAGVRLLLRAGPRPLLLLVLAISAFSAFDDALQLHESVLPSLGLRERLVLLGYGALFLAWAWAARVGRGGETLAPLAVLALLATSVVVDELITRNTTFESHFLEDGSKLAAVGLWAGLHLRDLLCSATARAPDPAREPG